MMTRQQSGVTVNVCFDRSHDISMIRVTSYQNIYVWGTIIYRKYTLPTIFVAYSQSFLYWYSAAKLFAKFDKHYNISVPKLDFSLGCKTGFFLLTQISNSVLYISATRFYSLQNNQTINLDPSCKIWVCIIGLILLFFSFGSFFFKEGLACNPTPSSNALSPFGSDLFDQQIMAWDKHMVSLTLILMSCQIILKWHPIISMKCWPCIALSFSKVFLFILFIYFFFFFFENNH